MMEMLALLDKGRVNILKLFKRWTLNTYLLNSNNWKLTRSTFIKGNIKT